MQRSARLLICILGCAALATGCGSGGASPDTQTGRDSIRTAPPQQQSRTKGAWIEPSAGPPRLRRALERYRAIVAGGGWPAIPPGKLQRGSSGPAVALLRRHLEISGDLHRAWFERLFHGAGRDAIFDAETEAALRTFQERHGLNADGVLGPKTIEALDVPAEVRANQLSANLARAQNLPRLAKGRTIVVNIPEYYLRAYDAGQEVLAMRVVIGTEFNPTPAFSDRMTYLVFRPSWNIPKRIASEEIVPEILRDAGVLERKELEVVEPAGDSVRVVDADSVDWSQFDASRYMLRRRPGPRNPLGDVKFMFPNAYDVYLHDTPQDNLFRKEDRTFSHGCVRVEKPLELAAFVLRGKPEWDRDRIRTAMTTGESQIVSLPEPIPVHIVYWTAWVDDADRVHFRDDVYRLDVAGSGDSIAAPPARQREAQIAKHSGKER